VLATLYVIATAFVRIVPAGLLPNLVALNAPATAAVDMRIVNAAAIAKLMTDGALVVLEIATVAAARIFAAVAAVPVVALAMAIAGRRITASAALAPLIVVATMNVKDVWMIVYATTAYPSHALATAVVIITVA